MLPMVASRHEWLAVLGLWREAARDAGAEAGVSLLVETPAAALNVARLLPEADEVSIGTNDLQALLFGLDRERASAGSQPHLALEPVVLRLVAAVIQEAHQAGLPVTICGEDAGRLPEALVLWGLGADKLSVSPGRLVVAQAIRALDGPQVREVADDVLARDDVGQVLARLEAWRRDLASRGTMMPDWPEGWEGHDDDNDLGGGLA